MADNRKKRKAWVYCKEAKIPKTTAWRSRTLEKENAGGSLTSDSSIVSSPVEISARSSCTVSAMFDNVPCLDYFESDQSSPLASNCDHVIETLCDDQSNEGSTFFDDPVTDPDESLSFLIDMGCNSVTSSEESQSSSEKSESETEQSDSGSDSECDSECNSEHDDETSNPETPDEAIEDDSVPLYNGAKVSRLGALILVMLFSLRHQLSGKALIDLIKVLHAFLPDGHKFVASAYLLKKYFADLFGEPAPTKHSYCGNCLGRIQKGHAECLKEKCQNSKKKIEYFLELDLHIRLCQLYRGKLK